MADKALKISELNAITAPSGDDILVIVDDPSGTPTTKKVTVANLLGNSSANVVIQNVTPANGTITVKKGTIMFDNSFIYIATANNVIKKVALSAF
jgi:hypothetical protein